MHIGYSNKTRKTIRLIGCGGGGCRFIQEMADENIKNVDFYAINTDVQDLINTRADNKILIGLKKTQGLGAGGLIQIGEEAAIENIFQIRSAVAGSDVVFIMCALGGGNSGAAPVIAKAAKDTGALTIALVTLPFHTAGTFNATNAEIIYNRLLEIADTIIVVPLDILQERSPNEPMETLFDAVAKKYFAQAINYTKKLITKQATVKPDFEHDMVLMNEIIPDCIIKDKIES